MTLLVQGRPPSAVPAERISAAARGHSKYELTLA